jgi:starvation-inducible DNA-binding protein
VRSHGCIRKPREIRAFATVNLLLPLDLQEPVRLEITAQVQQLVADMMAIPDLYKKSHWQTVRQSFYQLHVLFDKHYDEQAELVDAIERIQLLGGVSIAMAHAVAETTLIERPPRGREELPVQLSRLLDAHRTIITQVRNLARRVSALRDDGTKELVVSEVLRRNELQTWLLSEHLVAVPLVEARSPSASVA